MSNNDISYFENLYGTSNDLSHVLFPPDAINDKDNEDELLNLCHSPYMSMALLKTLFQNKSKEFLIMTLNIQSLKAKFGNLYPIISDLSAAGLRFGAICIQETWLKDNDDVSLYDLPGYKLIHQGYKCTAKKLFF